MTFFQFVPHLRRPWTTALRKATHCAHHRMQLIDIAANLTDEMYQGIYYGKQVHPPDLDAVLQRAKQSEVERIIVTGGNLESSQQALALAESENFLYSTVGVHPTRCDEFVEEPESHLAALLEVVQKGKESRKVVAIGECGLDYDRMQFCSKETQKTYFAAQFWLTEQTRLPMFLHMREAASDFLEILKQNQWRFYGGVVHSFTGTAEDIANLCALNNVYIGVNGCSLKTEENLQVLSAIPVERMMIETDCPYCEIRNSHASKAYIRPEHLLKAVDKKKHNNTSLIKGRNEPCNIRQILDVVAAIKEMDPHVLADQLYQNTMTLFFNS